MFAFRSAQLLQIKVEHGSQAVDQFGPQERVGNGARQIVQHVDRLSGQSQVRLAHSLVGGQLAQTGLLLFVGLLVPRGPILHSFLNFVDALQRFQALVEQERRVVHQHIDELDELLAGLELLDDRLAMDWTLPETFENDADVEADREFVVELGRGAGRLDIGVKLHQ